MSFGWFKESYRHSLARRGISTSRYMSKKNNRPKDNSNKSKIIRGLGFPTDLQIKERKNIKDVTAQDVFKIGRKPSEVDYMGAIGQGSPETSRRRLKGATALGKEIEEKVRSKRLIPRLQDDILQGRTAEGINVLKKEQEKIEKAKQKSKANFKEDIFSGKFKKALQDLKDAKQAGASNDKIDSIKTALEVEAIKQAQSGIPVSEEVLSQLDPNVRKRVEAIQKQSERELESPFKTAIREQEKKLAVGAVDATVLGAEEMLGGGIEGIRSVGAAGTEKYPDEFPGLIGEIDKAEQLPMFQPTSNKFIDDKPISKASDMFDYGQAGDTANIALKGSNNILFDGSGSNAVLKKSYNENTYSNVTKRKVDQLFASMDKLAKVDLSIFDKGNKAFEKGDREGLIKSIANLQSQESVLKDRWNLVSQTHSQVISNENHESALRNKSDGGIFNFGGGADLLADETNKVNKVRNKILDSANQLHARRKMLQYRLQRMDASVPPETWVPDQVDRFDDDMGSNLLKVNNPVTNLKTNPFFEK